MSDIRRIFRVWKSKPTIEGAGVHLKRAFGFHQVPKLDPFLMLDDFHSNNPEHYLKGFPWHPHRGIETITYMIEGKVEHGDSMGNSGTIGSGDIQWMTAGSGIIHQEMPKGSSTGVMWGLQLWANLPAAQKMMDPRYRDVGCGMIPEAELPGGIRVKVVAGEVAGVQGPVRDIVIDPEYLDVSVPAGETFIHSVTNGHTVFAYVLSGDGYFDPDRSAFSHEVAPEKWWELERPCSCDAETLVHYGDGEEIRVTAKDGGVRFLLISGKPLGEPVAWYGPIVMNTKEELELAFREYEQGTFVKHPKT